MSAPAASARLPGMVQGVVVQMTTLVPASGPFRMGKRTQTVSLVRSWYSISASASAVFSTTLHMTGRRPRYRAPLSRNLPISPAMAASAVKSMVA